MSCGFLDGIPDQEKPLVDRSAWFRPYICGYAGSLTVQTSDTEVSCPGTEHCIGRCGTLCPILATFL